MDLGDPQPNFWWGAPGTAFGAKSGVPQDEGIRDARCTPIICTPVRDTNLPSSTAPPRLEVPSNMKRTRGKTLDFVALHTGAPSKED